MSKKNGLGRGLEHLMDQNKIISQMSEEEKRQVQMIKLENVKPNPYQPRKRFDEDALNELAQSISTHGLFQPILVREGLVGYEIISGERRTRACRLIGLDKIPAIVYEYDEEQMMEVAIVENIQREDLSVVEQAKSFKVMMENLNLTQDMIATKLGKSRAYVANIVRILKLDDEILDMLDRQELTLGHVKVLIAIENKDVINKIINRIVEEKLSVRDTEEIVKEYKKPLKEKKVKDVSQSNRRFENLIREKLQTKVKITGEDKGKIEINYSSAEELQRILEEMHIG